MGRKGNEGNNSALIRPLSWNSETKNVLIEGARGHPLGGGRKKEKNFRTDEKKVILRGRPRRKGSEKEKVINVP